MQNKLPTCTQKGIFLPTQCLQTTNPATNDLPRACSKSTCPFAICLQLPHPSLLASSNVLGLHFLILLCHFQFQSHSNCYKLQHMSTAVYGQQQTCILSGLVVYKVSLSDMVIYCTEGHSMTFTNHKVTLKFPNVVCEQVT